MPSTTRLRPSRGGLLIGLLGGLLIFGLSRGVLAERLSTEPATGLHANTPAVHALVGAKVVVAPGEVLEKATIVVRNGVIEAVGVDIQSPADARVWDLTGKTIYPGLIDAFSEITVADASGAGPGYWNALIVPQTRAERGYKPDAEANKKYRSQGIASRQVLPAAGLIKGTSAVVTTGDGDARQSVVRAPVALHIEPTIRRGASRDGYPNSPMGALTLVRQAFLDADWYEQAWRSFLERPGATRPEQNLALQALADARAARLPCVIDAADDLYFFRADKLGKEFRLDVVIRGSGDEFRRLDAVKATGRPVIVPVNFPQPPDVTSVERAATASLEDLLVWDHAPENPARLEQAGVKIALTAHGLKDVGGFLAAVRKAVDRGLSADAALRALTTTPAELLGIEEGFGAIRVGKTAALVVASGNLFDKKTKVLETWVDGERYEIESPPAIDARGTWELTFAGADRQPIVASLILEGEPNKLTGTVARGEKKTKLTQATINESQLHASFKGDEVDWPGVLQLSATLSKSVEGEWSGLGVIAWPDARRERLTARRTAEFKPADSDARQPVDNAKDSKPTDDPNQKPVVQPVGPPAEGEAKTAGEPALSKPVVEPVAEGKPAEAAHEGAESPNDNPADQPADKPTVKPAVKPVVGTDASVEKSEDQDASPAEKKADKPENLDKRRALYPVNYPLGAWGRSQPAEQPAVVVFQHATVWTCGPNGTLEDASVIIENGKIKAVGKDVAVPAGATVVDLTGKHLTPGIIDCHSHIATDGGVNESGQAITAEVRIGDFIDSNDVNIYRQLAGGVTSSNILHGSANPIGGQNQVIKLRWGLIADDLKFAEAPPGIKFALGENVKQSNWGERFTSRYPQTRMGVEQIVRDEFLAAQAYRRQWEEYRRTSAGLPPRTDLELEAVAEILEGKRLVHCHSYRQDEILALIRTCADFNVRIATLQHILEGYKLADVMAEQQIGGSSFSDWWAYKFEVLDAIPYNGAIMHDAGVLVSFNSDDAELARRLNLEAAKAVKYGGVSPDEALKFVTLNPAKQLRIDRWVGSVEPEKHADLAIWSGSPLSNYSHCEATWIDGRKYFDRQADLAQRIEVDKMRAALVQRVLASGEASADGESSTRQRDLWPREDIYCHHHNHRDGDDHEHDHDHELSTEASEGDHRRD